MPVEAEADEDQHAYETEGEGDDHAELTGGVLGFNSGGESPLAKEIPNADAEVERRSENADGGEEEEVGIGEEVFDFGVSGFAVGEPALGVEVPGDVGEGDETGVALGGVEPVPYPGIGGNVGPTAYPYIDAVAGVVKHGEKDEGPLDEGAERDGLEVAGDFVVLGRGDEDSAVGPEMFGKEGANGNDSGERMKFSEKIVCFRPGCRRRHALSAAGVPKIFVERECRARWTCSTSSIGSWERACKFGGMRDMGHR